MRNYLMCACYWCVVPRSSCGNYYYVIGLELGPGLKHVSSSSYSGSCYLTKQVEQVLFDLRVTKNPVLLRFPNCYYLSSLWEINCSCSRLKLEIANLISIIMVKGSKVELRLEISDKEKKKKNNCGDGFRWCVNKSSRVLKFQAYSFSFVSNVSWDWTHYQTILYVQLWFIFL